MKTKILAAILLFSGAANAACSNISLPYDFLTIPSGNRAALAGNFNELANKGNACQDSVDEIRQRFEGYSGNLRMKSQENLYLRLDADGSAANARHVVETNSGDSIFRVSEDKSWRFFGNGTVTKITASDSIIAPVIKANTFVGSFGGDTGNFNRVNADTVETGLLGASRAVIDTLLVQDFTDLQGPTTADSIFTSGRISAGGKITTLDTVRGGTVTATARAYGRSGAYDSLYVDRANLDVVLVRGGANKISTPDTLAASKITAEDSVRGLTVTATGRSSARSSAVDSLFLDRTNLDAVFVRGGANKIMTPDSLAAAKVTADSMRAISLRVTGNLSVVGTSTFGPILFSSGIASAFTSTVINSLHYNGDGPGSKATLDTLRLGFSATPDVNLYRRTANVLKTDDALEVVGYITSAAAVTGDSLLAGAGIRSASGVGSGIRLTTWTSTGQLGNATSIDGDYTFSGSLTAQDVSFGGGAIVADNGNVSLGLGDGKTVTIGNAINGGAVDIVAAGGILVNGNPGVTGTCSSVDVENGIVIGCTP